MAERNALVASDLITDLVTAAKQDDTPVVVVVEGETLYVVGVDNESGLTRLELATYEQLPEDLA
jgi:hypothetical protein